jgi:hypothetical protein
MHKGFSHGPSLLPIRVLGGVIAVLCSVGCGAKTGLEVPDSQVDAGVDAGPDATIPCIEIPIDGGVVDLPLQTQVELGRADVVFAIDTTASMGQEIDEIRANLRNQIVPGIRTTIRDSQIGVTTFADFPEGSCGAAGDLPFRLVLPVTEDVGRVQSAVDSISLDNGSDEPESQVEALYQIATGEGVGTWVPASFGCPTGGFGYPCFRTDALPVVLLFTDAPFHNGPGGARPYADPRACPIADASGAHDYSEMTSVLEAAGIRVIGLYSGPSREDGFRHLEQLARDTNAMSVGGPLVFDIGQRGERLSESVVQAIATLADVVEFDIDTELLDVDRTDGVDPREFVEAVVPLRAEPPDGVREIDFDNGVFRGVRTGTMVVFQLRLRAGVVAPGVGPQRFLLEVVFRGDGRTRIDSRIIEIVVPGADGSGCEDGSGVVVPPG